LFSVTIYSPDVSFFLKFIIISLKIAALFSCTPVVAASIRLFAYRRTISTHTSSAHRFQLGLNQFAYSTYLYSGVIILEPSRWLHVSRKVEKPAELVKPRNFETDGAHSLLRIVLA
jgi:hypothetical protein